jgi:hypothetical protein
MPKAIASFVLTLKETRLARNSQPFQISSKDSPHKAFKLPLNTNLLSKSHTSQQSALHKEFSSCLNLHERKNLDGRLYNEHISHLKEKINQ